LTLGVNFFYQQVAQFISNVGGRIAREGASNQPFSFPKLSTLNG
jgi:hypothetical protein